MDIQRILGMTAGQNNQARMDAFVYYYKSGKIKLDSEGRYDDLLNTISRKNQRLNSHNLSALEQQLTFVEATVQLVRYPQYTIRNTVPFNTEGGPWLQAKITRSKKHYGSADYVTGKNNDFPRADFGFSQDKVFIEPIGISYGWNYLELEQYAKAGINISMDGADAANRGMEQALDEIGYGIKANQSSKKHQGLLSDLTIYTEYTLPADGTGSTKTFSTKTGKQVERDILAAIAKVQEATLNTFVAGICILPLAQFLLVTRTRATDYADMTIAQFITQTTGVKFYPVFRLKGAYTPGPLDIGMVYPMDNAALQMHVPRDKEPQPMFQDGREWITDNLLDCGGIEFKQPKSIVWFKGC